MESGNFAYLVYGLSAAWLILFGYALVLGGRAERLGKELERLKEMVEGEKGERSK